MQWGEKMSTRLVEKTTDSLIKYILNNNLKENDKLPNEYDLAKELGVGRSTLREAVRSLSSRNILEVRHGSGTYISDNIGIGDDPLGFTFIKDTLKLTEDLFTLRYILEPEVAMLAAQMRTDKQLIQLKDIEKQLEKAMTASNRLHFELDIAFHSLIAEMSGNIALRHLVPIINESITLYNSYYTNDQSKYETIEAHREIVRSIETQDIFRAKSAMQRHINNNRLQLDKNKEK